jgi:hypothetical protein
LTASKSHGAALFFPATQILLMAFEKYSAGQTNIAALGWQRFSGYESLVADEVSQAVLRMRRLASCRR